MTEAFKPRFYVLSGHAPVLCDGLEDWAMRFDAGNKHVAEKRVGDVWVSTVFLGVDHRYFGEGPPVLFETMIFGGEHDQFQRRYSTWEEAEEGHKEAVARAKGTAA